MFQALAASSARWAVLIADDQGFGIVAIVFGGLVMAIRLFRLFSRAEAQRDDELYRGPPADERPQIAGLPCAACGVKIAVVFDGVTCAQCQKPVHKDCV